MTRKFNQFIGMAGHLAMMSEFLMRGWNVAIPEVDIGDDIFVVHDEEGLLQRVQVKTATGIPNRNGFSARFTIPTRQLFSFGKPQGIYYAFIVRFQDRWTLPVIIRQRDLLDYVDHEHRRSPLGEKVQLYFSFQNGENKVKWAGRDLSKHLADFTDFPIIHH